MDASTITNATAATSNPWVLALAVIGAIFGAGGFAVQIVLWLRARSEKHAENEGKRIEVSAVVEKHEIDADLTLNDRLLKRIESLEKRMDEERDAHRGEIRALEGRNDECERRYDALERENQERVRERERENLERERREKELREANRLLLYSYQNLRSDLVSIRKHVDRIEDENRRLRDELERRTSLTLPSPPPAFMRSTPEKEG